MNKTSLSLLLEQKGYNDEIMGPLLLTWYNINPCMDK